jgi:hypothetical protein
MNSRSGSLSAERTTCSSQTFSASVLPMLISYDVFNRAAALYR